MRLHYDTLEIKSGTYLVWLQMPAGPCSSELQDAERSLAAAKAAEARVAESIPANQRAPSVSLQHNRGVAEVPFADMARGRAEGPDLSENTHFNLRNSFCASRALAPPALEVLVVGHPNHGATTMVDLRGIKSRPARQPVTGRHG
jgi:hypothetical protein